MKRIQSFQSWDEEEEKKKEEERKTDRPMSFEEWQKKNSGTAASTSTSTPTQTSTPTPTSSVSRSTETATNRPVSFEQWDKQRRGEAEEEPERQYSSMDRYRPSGVYTPEQTEERKFSQNERYRPSGVVLGSPNVLEEPNPWDSLYTSGTIQRGKELAAKSTLTSEEKKEARAIQKEIDKVTRTSGVQKSDQYGELTDLNAKLYSKTSLLAGFGAGAIQALGLDWLTDRVADVVGAVSGVKSETGAKELVESAQKNNPLAYAAGNVAGNVMELSAISGAVGKALQGAEWFTKLAPWVQKAASSAITFGISGAASGIANTETKEEWDERERQQQLLAEDFGASYTPREYSIGRQLGKVGISAATGAASGALGSMLGSAFGAGTSNILVRNGLQYNTALRAIASGINGVGFAAGSTAAQELSKFLQYPKGYQPDAAEIGTNLAVAFLFSAASGIIGDAKSAKSNKQQMLKLMDDLAVEYETAKIKMAGMVGPARAAEAQRVLELSNRIRTSLATSQGMSGVQNEVKALAAALDIIDDQMAAIAAGGNGMLGAGDIYAAAGSAPGEPLAIAIQRIGANTPAPTGTAPQAQASVPVPSASTPSVPAWYTAYQNTPRPIDQPQQPTLPLPQIQQPQAAQPPVPSQQAVQTPQNAPSQSGTLPLPQPNNAPQERVTTPTAPASEAPSAPPVPSRPAETLTGTQESGTIEEKGNAPVEQAKQELKNAIRMPIQGTNEQALARGAETGELTMESVTIGGKVRGFTKEQQISLAQQIIEGTHEDNEVIYANVPDDGSFEIPNSPDNVAQVLNELHVKANQESIYTQSVDRWLRGANRVRITTIDGEKFITDGKLLYPVGDAGAEFAKNNEQGYKAEDFNVDEGTANTLLGFAENGTVVDKQPYVGKLGKSGQVYIFDTPDGRLIFNKRLLDMIDTGTMKYGMMDVRGKKYPVAVTVNSDGSIAGILYPIHNPDVDKVDLRQFTTGKLKSVGEQPIKASTPEISELPLPTADQTLTTKAEAKAPELPLPTASKPQATEKKPHEVLADNLIRYLEEGNTISSQELQRLADEAFGGSRASGAYDIKTAYDALELAVNKYLMDANFVKIGNGDVATAELTEKALENFMRYLPTQSVRTEEQQQFQQFSTPPNIAYLAAWAANIEKGDTVLEPSAGIGGLALWPKAWGAKVYGNELSERRADILRSLGLDEIFTENAEQINNVLPDYVKPSVVIMNPPFSATAGRLSTNNTANAKRHIEQALDRLEDGGRLVAILGRGMSNDSRTFAPWWDDLRKEYNIRANLSINGRNYHKYGTDFDVQLVVIDKTGPQTGETITGSYDDLTEIPSVLEGIRNDRTQLERQPGTVGERSGVQDVGRGGSGIQPGRPDGSSQRPVRAASGNGGSGTPVSTGNGGRVQPEGTGGTELETGRGNVGEQMGGKSGRSPVELPSEPEPERAAGPEPELSLPRVSEEPAPKPSKPEKKTAASKQKAGSDDGVYAEYIPPKTPVKGAKKHPANIVESAAMAAVDAPQATYSPKIPKELITSGALSDVQLTNIVYAGQAHSQMIPHQNIRRGYFIGDGTGVGKGRQIAGIILDNFMQGRKKAVWVSKGQNLFPDAKRDWSAMGMDPNDIMSSQKIKADAAIKANSGILFTTYDTLANKSKTGKSRLDQIVDWLGEDFDGVIAFDEAHSMGNLLGKKGKRGNSKPAEKALAGAELQKRLPKARVLYASATMATDVNEMAFAERLGLWGPGTQFANVRDFVEKISSGGMAAMELVARDMKAMGLYQARSISYNGVGYETLQHDLTPVQKEIYDTMSRAWQVTLQNMNKALEMTGANLNGNARAKAKSAYYGALQRFYNQILTSMAMPSVIADIKKELAAGRSVVLQIVNTNQAETDRQLARMKETGADLEDLDITPREQLIGFFRNAFPVQAYEEYEDENGTKRSRPVTDSNGNPVLDKKAVALRDSMIEEMQQMKVPEGPLEMLFDAFGVDQVAEVTGRTRRIVPRKDEYGNTVKVEEKRGSNSGEADASAFQDGKKHILVFSDAGGTGKSYHADLSAKNQEQRVHYLLQPGWSAPKAVQGFGRTHRSNEASAPIYKLITTDVRGQKRFVSTIARRLDQLGALTKGQRQTGSGMFSARDNLESDLATDSLYNFYRALVNGQVEGLEAQDVLEKLGLMDKFVDPESGQIKVPDAAGRDMSLFLNRILALEYDEQNRVFDAFSRIFDDAYETALNNGTLDMGMETVRADKIDILDDMIVREDPETGVATNYVQAKLSEKARIVRTIDDLKALRGDFIGLYRKKNGDAVGVFRTRDKTEANGSVVKQYILQTPTERKFSRYVESTLKKECERIPEKEWTQAWKAEVEKAPEYTETVKHMLTGSLLPVWNRLPSSGNVRVQRLIADDGRQYLGRVIAPDQIDSVLKSLGVTKGRTKQTYSVDDVISRVLGGGDKAVLENDRVTLTRRRVGGEPRIEITGDNVWFLRRTIPEIISENINYRTRFFIPTGENQKQVLEKILAQNPVSDIVQVRGDTEDSRDVSNFNGNNAPRHPENWTTERVGDANKTPMSTTDIIEKLKHDFNIPVTTGHIRSPNARAQYMRLPQSIRSKVANSIPDIAHELGHHLDDKYGLQDSIGDEAKREIIDAMPDSFKSQYKKYELVGEGIAEFMRRYLQNSEVAAIDYPIFSEWFLNQLNSKDLKAVTELADEMNAYYSLSEKTEAWPIHSREERVTDFRNLGEKLKDVHSRFRQLFVDAMEPIRRVDEQTGDNVHMFAINSAYAGNRAYSAITGDLYDLRGNKVGEGLQKALNGIHLGNKKEYSDFGMYLVCRHGPERLAEGMRVFNDDRHDNTAWMEQTRDDLAAKYPAFEEAAQRLEEFQTNVLQTYGVVSGLYRQDTIDGWLDRWEHYVPFNRWFGDEKAKGQKRGFANQSGPYRKAVGSGRDIINPVDNIMVNTVRLIQTSIYNDVWQKLTRSVMKAGGIGNLMEQVPPSLARKTWDGKSLKSKTLETFENTLNSMGIPMNEATEDVIQKILDEAIEDVMVQYGRGKAHGDVVTVLVNGEPEYWKINDPDLLRTLTNMDNGQRNALLSYIGRVNRFITGNLTGMNIVWSLASNAPRDLGTIFTFSKTKNIAKILGGIFESYANKIKGDKASDLYKEYMALGGVSTTAQTADKDMTKKVRKALQKSKADWLNPLEWFEFVGNMIESGPRYSYYKIMRTKYDMTPEEAFYAAMEITTNFKRAGLLGRDINMVIPFFNASVQGVDRAARWLAADDLPKDQRKAGGLRRRIMFMGASLAIAGLSVLLNSRTKKDKDNFTKLSAYTKNNYFVIPMNDGKYLTIPKPRELAIPISFFERLGEYYVGENPNAFDDFWEYATDNVLPGVVSGLAQGDLNSAIGDLGAVGTLHYLSSNQDFLGRPIVSSSVENLEAKDQYTASTSRAAKFMGQLFNMSPQQIDFLGKNVLGGFWEWQKALAPVSADQDYTLGVKNKWVKDPLYSTDIPNRMYNQRDKLEKIKNSNPDDVDAAIDYRTVADMATFYGRYYRLAREDEDTESGRETRTAMLDMILGVESGAGKTEKAYRFMLDVLHEENSSELMPAVMETSIQGIKGGDDKNKQTVNLTAEEYFNYQTRYNSLYYNYIRSAMERGSMTAEEKTATLESAKKLAGIVAKGEILQKHGLSTKDYDKIQSLYDDRRSDIDDGELVSFLAAKSKADVDDSGAVSNAELLAAVSGLKLPVADEVALTRYANPDLALKLQQITPSGFSAGDYSKILGAVEKLKPLPGNDGVTNMQKCEAALGTLKSSASQAQKLKVMELYYGGDTKTKSGELSQWGKIKKATSNGATVEKTVSMLKSDTLDTYCKWIDSDAKKAGIKSDAYISYVNKYSNTRSERDANGKEIKGQTRKDKMMDYIDGLDMTIEQKDILYLEYYAESTLKDTPWHKRGGSGRGKTYSMSGLRLPTAERLAPISAGLELPTK